MEVCEKRCANCLISKNRIVSPERAEEIISECIETQNFFICHNSETVCCRGFYDKYGHYSQLVRIAQRLNAVRFVEVKETAKFMPYKDQ